MKCFKHQHYFDLAIIEHRAITMKYRQNQYFHYVSDAPEQSYFSRLTSRTNIIIERWFNKNWCNS